MKVVFYGSSVPRRFTAAGWNKEKWYKRTVKGVITVEMSYLIPMVLLLFVFIVQVVFYYHDKTILLGAAGETAVLGAQLERWPGGSGQADLDSFYQQRISGKLILFSGAVSSVSVSRDWSDIETDAAQGRLRLNVAERAQIARPEKKLRRKMIVQLAEQEQEE